MRVLTLTNTYPPHYYGGYELTCRDVMEHFEAAGHHVTVLTSDVRVPGVPDAPEQNVHRCLSAYWDWNEYAATLPRGPIGRLQLERRNLRALSDVLEASGRPDVVSVWHMGGLSLSLLTEVERLGLPIVLTVANDWLVHGPSLDGWARLWRHWPAGAPHTVLGVPTALPTLSLATANFVSRFTRARTTSDGRWKFPNAAIACPGVDSRDFPPQDPPAHEWQWRLLYVGRIDETKGVETLLRAAAELPAETTLTLLGGGNASYQARMQRLAADLGMRDRVTFASCPRSELADHYLACDAVVFPSEWDEPFGLVPLESMTCGVPVVTTIRGGSAEFLVDDLNCVSYPSGDINALVAALRLLAANPDLRSRLVAAGHETARQFTAERYATQLLDLHLTAAGRPNSPQ